MKLNKELNITSRRALGLRKENNHYCLHFKLGNRDYHREVSGENKRVIKYNIFPNYLFYIIGFPMLLKIV